MHTALIDGDILVYRIGFSSLENFFEEEKPKRKKKVK